MNSSTSSDAQFIYIWEFIVAPEMTEAFERNYGPGGSWAQLFQGAAGYLGTDLIRDCAQDGRYLTVDRWRSKEDYERFLTDNGDAFTELDQACESLTLRERKIGDFSPNS